MCPFFHLGAVCVGSFLVVYHCAALIDRAWERAR